MFETKKDYIETEMRTLIEQALSSKIFIWASLPPPDMKIQK